MKISTFPQISYLCVHSESAIIRLTVLRGVIPNSKVINMFVLLYKGKQLSIIVFTPASEVILGL